MIVNLDTPIAIFLIAGIYALWTFGFRRQFLDDTRSRLFLLRSNLFNLATEGKIKFDDPVYRQTELYINSLIKYTHRASILRILVGFRLYKNNLKAAKFAKTLTDGINNFPDVEVRNKLNETVQMASYFLFRQVINSNIITLLLFQFIIVPFIKITLLFAVLFANLKKQNENENHKFPNAVMKRFAEPTSLLEADAYCSSNNCNI